MKAIIIYYEDSQVLTTTLAGNIANTVSSILECDVNRMSLTFLDDEDVAKALLSKDEFAKIEPSKVLAYGNTIDKAIKEIEKHISTDTAIVLHILLQKASKSKPLDEAIRAMLKYNIAICRPNLIPLIRECYV